VALGGIEESGLPAMGFGIGSRSIAAFTPGDVVRVASGGPGWVVSTSGYGRIVTLGFQRNGVVEDSWGEHGTQINDVGSIASPVAIRYVSAVCLHGSCRDPRFLVAASTQAAPGGVLVRLNP
jgi:uncharacterized protein YodC (DUF2158 family)